MSKPALSVVVVAYNMARELPRTLLSLSPKMQRDIRAKDYEILVMDNGSEPPVDSRDLETLPIEIRVHRVQTPSPSPAAAINQGIRLATADFIGVWIDGARLASPGMLANALRAARLHPRPVIGAMNLHLGPDIQRCSVQSGYSQTVEDALLSSVDWTSDGYRLFRISAFGGSCAGGWFMPIGESNSVFMRREHWYDLGGYSEAFVSPGGGLVNLDLWRRAVTAEGAQVILLLGEGTFHQLHGGAFTNAQATQWNVFAEEYRKIRNADFSVPEIDPIFLGRAPTEALAKLAWSASHAADELLPQATAREDGAGRPAPHGQS